MRIKIEYFQEEDVPTLKDEIPPSIKILDCPNTIGDDTWAIIEGSEGDLSEFIQDFFLCGPHEINDFMIKL